jgi:epoxide hydrolase-like predicted phosphatase
MIKTIVSDLGGVFLNRGLWLFWDYLLKEYGIPIEKSKTAFLADYKPYFAGKMAEPEFWKNFLEKVGINQDWNILREKLLSLYQVNEGVAELYTELKNKGICMVLLSDQILEWWPVLEANHKISSYFDSVIISSQTGLTKPDEKIYEYALNQVNAKPEESLFIDDLEHNLEPARKIGMKTILFKDADQLRSELEKIIK